MGDILTELGKLQLSAEELNNLKKEIDSKKGEKSTLTKEIEILKKSLEEQRLNLSREKDEHLHRIADIKTTIGKLVLEKEKVESSTKAIFAELSVKKEEIEKAKNELENEKQKNEELKNQANKLAVMVSVKSQIIEQIVELAKKL